MGLLSRSAGARLDARFVDVHVVRDGPRFTVYAARERATQRSVAIKTPTDRHAAWLGEQLEHEALVLTRVGPHPHIVEFLGRYALPDGRPALLLDATAGVLEDTLRADRRMPAPDVTTVGVQLAGALESVHQAGFVHGNVRPQIVLVDAAGTPLLAGFDESAAIGAEASSRPLHVTTAHTAPEVLEGGMPTPASDVYGLASTLYELLAGRAAFRAYVGESPATVIVRVLSNPVRTINAPGVPLELSDLLTWALSPDPARRPPGPAWLAEELRRVQSRQGWLDTKMIVA